MKRKVIQLAGKTMVVSLPSKWVKSHNVKKGEEIDIEERGRELLLKTGAEPEVKRAEFDTRGQNERVIAWTSSALYKLGYDEIEFIYDDKRVINQLQQALKDFFVGFVVINQTKSRCTVKNISRESEEEFESTLRRAFLVTITMGENLSDAIKKKDDESVKSLLSLEKTNNQLTAFCERVLKKVGHSMPDKTIFYYVVAWNLEKVCDDYKYICQTLAEGGGTASVNKDVAGFLDDVNGFLGGFYELFYRYDAERLLKFSGISKELSKKGNGLFDAAKGDNKKLVSLMLDLVIKINDFAPSTVSIRSGLNQRNQ